MQNQKMLDVGKPDVLLVFPGGPIMDMLDRVSELPIKIKRGGG